MTVLEAAGYDVVLVETVGVGQSEITVAGMVDTFLFLTLARTGDQLQGIKKGILEIADVIAVNKADGDREQEARAAARELAGALRLVRGHDEWAPPVVTCSALEGTGVDRRVGAGARPPRAPRRRTGWPASAPSQQLDFTWALVRDELDQRLRHSAAVAAVRAEVRAAVLAGELPAPVAADRILAAYDATARRHDRAVAAVDTGSTRQGVPAPQLRDMTRAASTTSVPPRPGPTAGTLTRTCPRPAP